jgi:hypothetical protein
MRLSATTPLFAKRLSGLVCCVIVIYKKTMPITNPTDCEVCSMISFSNTKNICHPKIHHQLVEVCEEGVFNEHECA